MPHVKVYVKGDVVWTEKCKDLPDARQFFDIMVESTDPWNTWERLELVTSEGVVREAKIIETRR